MQKSLQCLAAMMWLSWCVEVRLPAATPWQDWLLPSFDVAVLLGLFVLFAPRADWQAPRPLLRVVCGLLLCVRAGRVADGICRRFLDRSFHLASDLALVPELGRLGVSSLGAWRFAGVVVLTLAAALVCWLLLMAALRTLTHALSQPRMGDVYLATVGVLALLSLWLLPLVYPGKNSPSLFAHSVSPRLAHEAELWFAAHGLYGDPAEAVHRRVFSRRWTERQTRFVAASKPPDVLDRLHGVDVHVILVEAYGHTVMSTPAYAARLAPAYAQLMAALERAGFSVCTDFMRATVFGGNSWLSHATLETAVPIADQSDYALLQEQHAPWTLAKVFASAGYRTVSVKPGTTRASPHTRMYGFDREYAARDLGYQGPTFAWAPMPDQYVLEQIAERELQTPHPPLMLEYALVSSHFPFSPWPAYIDDWASLGDGSLFWQRPAMHARGHESALSASPDAYLSTIEYDLHVLGEFVARYVHGDALVLIFGDHQPIAPIAGNDRSRSTPLHVLSRRDDLLQPFRARGCVPGLIGGQPEPHRPFENLALDLLHDFSTPRVGR